MQLKHKHLIIDLLNQHIRAINRAIEVTDEITAEGLKLKRENVIEALQTVERSVHENQ